jgi:superfamily II DNA or RNA helicase
VCSSDLVYYVDGGTDKDFREVYKKKMENNNNVILVASYGTFSTGISVKRIHNIFLTESFKSEVIIRQSIGRGLRKHESKNMLNIVDFVDDMRYTGEGRVYKNYLYRHAEARREIYTEQKFPYSIKNVKF